MEEQILFISWGQVPRGREIKAYEVFNKVHDFLRKKKEEGKIREIRTYFNSQGSGMAGFMLVAGGPELLAEGARELENLYTQAAAVVDNLSLEAVSGGTIARIQERLDRWMDVQKELGFFG